MLERSCLIVKPDGVCKNICGQIFATLQSNDLKLIALKMLKPGKEVIEQFYSIHIGQPFFEKLISFMLKAPIIVSVWEGENAVAKIRQLTGATNSADAAPGTLRAKYGTDNRRNVVHASDSIASADIEIKHFFADHEIFNYSQDAWKED